ncbi:unnamed protein product [Anisakis simplex]|uniref:G_PROTEIN_RECEP_F1_2 domain-containing protein n=1 Tax=Anisakis simplex TaxID=6269 RepID=A0A0M3JZU0_ANISI|nr:unnamed protein product [Anisakis simplex]
MNVTEDGCGDECDIPPEHLFSDFIEMTYLLLVIVIGTPANIYVLTKLFRELRTCKNDSVKIGFLLLKINLNISDLIILIILAVGKFCWLATYAWNGGDLLCKLFNFMSMFALYISSNIVVCIALDRLRNVVTASKIRRRHSTTAVRSMIVISWLLSLLWSVPQLWVWRTLNVYPNYPGGWVQCSDIWSIERFQALHHPLQYMHSELTQNIYNISHLVLVFWGPLLVLLVSYAFIAFRLMQYSIRGPQCSDNSRLIGLRTSSPNFSQRPSIIVQRTDSTEANLSRSSRRNQSIQLQSGSMRKSLSEEYFIDLENSDVRRNLPLQIGANNRDIRAASSVGFRRDRNQSMVTVDSDSFWPRVICAVRLACGSQDMYNGRTTFAATLSTDSNARPSVASTYSNRRSLMNIWSGIRHKDRGSGSGKCTHLIDDQYLFKIDLKAFL